MDPLNYPAEAVYELLHTDPFLEAEKLTGHSYKQDNLTGDLGILIHLSKGQCVDTLMKARKDTHFSQDMEEAIEIYRNAGFVKIFEETNLKTPHHPEEEPWAEMCYAFYHFTDGILLWAETYRGKTVNTSDICFNWKPNAAFGSPDQWYPPFSGGFTVPHQYREADYDKRWNWTEQEKQHRILVGKIDIRVGLNNTLEMMRAKGTFVKKWAGKPMLWFVSHCDIVPDSLKYPESTVKYSDLTNKRLLQFPQAVLEYVLVPEEV